MKVVYSIFALSLIASSAMASSERCYQLSIDGKAWSRTPEILCVIDKKDPQGKPVPSQITLKTGLMEKRIVGTFDLDLLSRVRGINENKDEYGISNPSNSIFNEIKVKFDGTRNFSDEEMTEEGKIRIGKSEFFYRSSK